MRQAIRALGWASTLFWIFLLFFTVTSAYSAFLIAQGLRFGEPTTSVQGGSLTVSLPFVFGDTGLYDICDFNITTLVLDSNGFSISESSTLVPLIQRASSNFTVEHDISLNASQFATANLAYLLFNDTDLTVDAILKLNFARAIPIELSTNISLPWGAPFYGLTVNNISVSPLAPGHFQAVIPISYENHAFFDLDGTIELQLIDNAGNQLGTGTGILLLRGGQIPITIDISNPQRITQARLFFHTSYFDYGPYDISGLEIPRVAPSV
jgi:hypothetical protein